MTSNANSTVNTENVDTEMKIQQNEEMLKCFTITKMTDKEIRDNPVQFNPIVYVPWHKTYDWNQSGLITSCCAKHKDKGIKYGQCPNHLKINWTAESLSGFGTYGDNDDVFLFMFHDHTWYDKSLNHHLSNREIFIGFPLSKDAFFKGNSVPCYDKFSKPLSVCFNDIKWLFPVQCHDLFLCDWDCRTPYYNMVPIVQNWYKCRSSIQEKAQLHDKINDIKSQLSEVQDQLHENEQKAQQDWDTYVDTEFHSQFAKCCHTKFCTTFKVCIPGVTHKMISDHLLIFEDLQYFGTKLIIIRNLNNTKLYTPKKQGKADWIVDHVFNNGKKYCYTDMNTQKSYEPYDIDFVWDLNRKSSLIFSGKIAKKNLAGFFTKIE